MAIWCPTKLFALGLVVMMVDEATIGLNARQQRTRVAVMG
jgi:hypothetical protein